LRDGSETDKQIDNSMIKTYGLTHIALAVKSAKRSFEFYRKSSV